MKNSLILFVVLLTLTLNGCDQQPDLDVSKAVALTEIDFRQLDEISTTAASYNKEQVKFRLMVEKHPSFKEAVNLFRDVLNKLEEGSGNSEFWDYYHGHFDIKSYDEGVIFEATKEIGKELEITKRVEQD